jgi:proline iminopeptidase
MSNAKDIRIEDNVIFTKKMGSGEPIIFLHGGPGLSHDYLVQPFEQLSSKYELIFFDQRGSGASSALGPDQTICIDDFVTDIETLRKSLKLSDITLIGHSWGGLLAVLYAKKFGNSLRKMILIDPAPGNSSLDNAGRSIMRGRLSVEDIEEINSIMKNKPFETQDMVAINRFIQINERPRFFDQSYLSRNKPTFTFEMIVKLQTVSGLLNEELDDYDIYHTIQGVDIKTLVIHGDYDPIPVESSKKYSEMLPSSKFQLMDDCGHFPFIEKQKETLMSIEDFLTE